MKNNLIALSMLCFFSFFSCASDEKHPQEKYALLVATPGRSGSSALTKVLDILGATIGSNFYINANNPKGYFEEVFFLELNKKILKNFVNPQANNLDALFSCRKINWDTEPKRMAYEHEIIDGINTIFGNSTIFAIKDPRMVFLLPLYISAVKKLGFIPKIIVQIRDPQEIVQSLSKMMNTRNDAFFYAYISRSLMSILEHTDSTESLTIYFDDLLNNTEQTVSRLHAFIPGLKSFNECKQELHEFLDKDLKHENC